jgi:DNA-binding CsgD family transcriptional regulator
VGRRVELAALDEMVRSLGAGSGCVLLIEGASGTGKSSLLAELRRAAVGGGVAVRDATAIELDSDQPFAVIERALNLGAVSAVQAGSAVALAEGGLAAVHRISRAILELADAAPLLVCADDAQWADEQSLRVLEVAASSVRHRRLGIALAWRRGELSEPHLGRLLALQGTVHLSLEDLAAEEAAVLVRRSLAQADSAFVEACYSLTGGNPLLLEEVLAAFGESGLSPDVAAAERLAELTPTSATRAVLARLGRLTTEAMSLASAAAVLGDGAPLHQAARLAGLEAGTAADAADGLVSVEIFSNADTLAFRHPLHRAAVLDDIGGFTRSELHRRAAAIVAADGQFERAGALLLRASPGGDPNAVTHLRKAAGIALRSGDARTAIRLLERALAEPAPTEERPALLVDLARAEVAVGDPRSVEHLDAALREIGGPAERVGVLRSLARLHHARYEFPRAAQLAEQALSDVPADGKQRDRFVATWLLAASLDPERYEAAQRLYRELADGAHRGAPPTDPELQASLSLYLVSTGGDCDMAAELAEGAVAGDAVTNDDGLGLAGDFALHTLLCCGRLEALVRCADTRFESVEHHSSVMGAASAACWRAHGRMELGDLLGAITDAETALVPSRYGWPVHSTYGGGALALARLELGDLEGAIEAVRQIIEVPIPDPPRLYFTAAVELAAGRATEARAMFEQAGKEILANWGSDTPALMPWRSSAALAAWREGDTAAAHELAAEEVALARNTRVPRAIGRALRVRGLVLGGDEGIETLREACAVLAATDCTLELLRAQVNLGATLRRGGARRDARDLLRAARARAESLGCVALAQRAAGELSASGARPRRVPVTGVESLTPSERRIAELAAVGSTNREIAADLFLTTKTVEWHLGHVFSKLDIRGRRELSAALAKELPLD